MIKDLHIILLYPPEQNWPGTMAKPNGSLAYPMLAGALIENGFEVKIFDACVGSEKDDLAETFYKSVELPNGMLRSGVSDNRILEEIYDFDIVGITSIFSHQETIALSTIKLIKSHYPNKIVIVGGVNARNRIKQFMDADVDIICTSEAEFTIVDICKNIRLNLDLSSVPKIIYKKGNQYIINDCSDDIIWDLDTLPMPRWDLLPNERYWTIRRPHGGHFEPEEELRYVAMETSRGCPFMCSYCHIAGETKNSLSGEIGRFRIKSDERIIAELEFLKDMSIKQIFIEDDSLLGKKKRAIKLLNKILGMNFDILDVNGINIIHLLKKGEPDIEVIELLAEVGFKHIALPFESASPRIIKQYCSNKWDITNSNIPALIKTCKDYGMVVEGNYMLGYPDETLEEVNYTINYAHDRMKDGLDIACFFLVMPLPGTPLFDYCITNGYLPQDFNPDRMHWQKANMINTTVPPNILEDLRNKAWKDTNNKDFIEYKKEMVV